MAPAGINLTGPVYTAGQGGASTGVSTGAHYTTSAGPSGAAVTVTSTSGGAASTTTSSGGGGLGGIWHALTNLPGALLHAVTHAIVGFFVGILTAIAHFVAWVPVALFDLIVRNETTIILQNEPWAQSLLHFFILVAYGMLGLRAVWEFLRVFTARAQGESAPISGVLRGVAWSAVAIAAGPFLAMHVIEWANDMTTAVIGILNPTIGPMLPNLLSLIVGEGGFIAAGAGVGTVAGASGVAITIAGVALPGTVLGAVIALIPILLYMVLLLVILFQMAIRSLDFLFAAFIAPFAALGYMSPNEGMAPQWFANVGILAGSQIVQVIFVYGAVGVLNTPGMGAGLRVLFSIAALVVALRGPHMLRQYTYHTGAGSIAMQTGQRALQLISAGKA